MKNATKLAFCSVVTALSVVLMFFGGISFIFAYAMPMLAGLLMIMLKTTFGSSSACITYVATSLLSFILVSDKECMLMYVMFFGFYPIIYTSLQKIKFTPLRIIIKLVIFNALMALVQLMLIYIFNIQFLEDGEGKAFIFVFVALMNLLFFIHDRLIKMLYIFYKQKIEKRIKNLIGKM